VTDTYFSATPSIANANAGAAHLVRSSLTRYGVLPDPQLAADAITTGAAPAVGALYNENSSQYAALLASQPVGQSRFTAQQLPKPTQLTQNPYQFDPKNYTDLIAQAKGMASGQMQDWARWGDIPVANIGWYQNVVGGDKPTVMRWQQYLAEKGYYRSADGKGQGAVNGYGNTREFQDAMKQWSLAYFLPTVLYSKDTQAQQQARMFLSSMGYDPDYIATLTRDPEIKAKAVMAWLAAQPPTRTHQKDSVNDFADQFGEGNLPPEIANLRDGWLSSIGNAFSSLPLVGHVFSMVQDPLVHGGFGYVHNWHDVFKDTQSVRADKIDAQLTDAERQALQPGLQDVHNSSGFLGFLDTWDHTRTRILLAGIYTIGDALHGKGSLTNVFDDHSKARTGAASHDENFFGGLWGDGAAQAHPVLSTLVNFTANIADDPMTYLPFVGEAGLGAKAVTAGAKLGRLERLSGGALSGTAGKLRLQRLYSAATVHDTLKRSGVRGLVADAVSPYHAAQRDVAGLLGRKLKDGRPLPIATAMHILQDGNFERNGAFVQKLLAAPTDEARLAMLTAPDSPYLHKLHDVSYLLNRNEHLRVVRNFDRLSSGKQISMLHMASTLDKSTRLNLGNRLETAETIEYAGHAASMDPNQLADVMDHILTAPTDAALHAAVGEFNDAWQKAADARLQAAGRGSFADFEKAILDARRGSWWRRSGGPDSPMTDLYAIERDPALPAVETSTVDRQMTFSDIKDAQGNVIETKDNLQRRADQIRQASDASRARYNEVVDAVVAGIRAETGTDLQGAIRQAGTHPEVIAARQQLQHDEQWVREELRALGGMGREGTYGAPATSEQLRTWGHLRYTPYELLAYLNPALWRLEWIQRKTGLDHLMSQFKSAVLSKPSTTARIVFGDESSRFHLHFLFSDPATEMRYMAAILKREKVVAMPEDLVMDLHRTFQGWHENAFHPFEPGDVGYKEALSHLISNWYGRAPETKVWTDAMRAGGEPEALKALATWLRGDSREAVEMRASRDIAPDATLRDPRDKAKFDALVQFMHTDRMALTRGRGVNSPMFDWLEKGSVNPDEFDKVARRHTYDGEALLPRVQGRQRDYSTSSMLSRYADWYHHNVTNAWVNKARSRGFHMKLELERRRLDDFYGPARDSAWKEQEAYDSAVRWVKRNTYQGHRTLAATAARTAAPFWGATANANRFYLRLMQEHPYLLDPSLRLLSADTQAQQSGGWKVPLGGLGGLLQKMGMAGGDEVSFDPGNAFFLTREGFGGLVPGSGPVFNFALRGLGSVNPQFVSGVSTLPGMQYVSAKTPLLPWLERLLSGASLKLTGRPFAEGAPLIGREEGHYTKAIDAKLQQLEGAYLQGGRQGQEPTVEQAASEVGNEMMLTGGVNAALPVGATVADQRKQAIMAAQKVLDAGGSLATVEQQFPDVADYFRYTDPSTPNVGTDQREGKQDIMARSPWVIPYAAGKTASTTGEPQATGSLQQYQAELDDGRLRLLTPQEYLTKIRSQEQINQGWNEYDRIQGEWTMYLQETGQSSTSRAAAAWKKANIDPQVLAVAQEFPAWGNTFTTSRSRTPAGLETATRPLATLAAFEVLPQNPLLETRTTVLWRATMQRMDQAATALRALIGVRGSQHEKDMIVNRLAQDLDGWAQQDQKFAAQLSHFRYRTVQDLLQYEAQVG
jgi:hypothetical protein